MKERKKEVPAEEPINLTWRDYLAGWNFPYSVPCRDKFRDFALGKKVVGCCGPTRLGRQRRNSPSVRSRLPSVTKLSDKHPVRLKRQGLPPGARLGSRQQTVSRRKSV